MVSIYERHLNIPVLICNYALKNRCVNQIKLYVYLKYISSGNLNFSLLKRDAILKDLNIKQWETVVRHLKWLAEKQIIIMRGKALIIKSYTHFVEDEEVSVKGAIFTKENFRNFKEFLIAASLKSKINNDFFWRSRKKAEDLSKGRSIVPDSANFFSNEFQSNPKQQVKESPVSATFLATRFGVSKTTGSNYKKNTKKAGLIEVQKDIVKTNIAAKQYSVIKANFGYEGLNVRIIGKKLCHQRPDKVKSIVCLRRNKGFLKAIAKKFNQSKIVGQ
jgi:hypothetical protein